MTQEKFDEMSKDVTAHVIRETGNPYQTPRESVEAPILQPHVKSADVNRTWRAPTITGFIAAAGMGEAISMTDNNLGLAMREMRGFLPPWLYIFGVFVAWPFAMGTVGAGVGLAVWLIRRVFARLIS